MERSMNSDKAKGTIKETKGKIEKAVGEVTGNPSTKAKGALDQVAGAIQKGVGEVKDAVKKAGK